MSHPLIKLTLVAAFASALGCAQSTRPDPCAPSATPADQGATLTFSPDHTRPGPNRCGPGYDRSVPGTGKTPEGTVQQDPTKAPQLAPG